MRTELSKESSRKISLRMGGTGEPNYHSVHKWVHRRLEKPAVCADCGGSKKLELCNISGEYKDVLSDWSWMCKSCHQRHDYQSGRRYRRYAPILQLRDGKVVGRFTHQAQASRETGIPPSNISFVLRGFNKTAGGYSWEYDGEPQQWKADEQA